MTTKTAEPITTEPATEAALFSGQLPKSTNKKIVDKTKPPFKVSPTIRICKDGHLWERDHKVHVPPYPFIERHTATGLDGSEITHFTKDDSERERKRRGIVLRRHTERGKTKRVWWDIAEPLVSIEEVAAARK